MTVVRALARPLLSVIFVVQGANAIRKPEPLVPKAQPVTDRLVLDRLPERVERAVVRIVAVFGLS